MKSLFSGCFSLLHPLPELVGLSVAFVNFCPQQRDQLNRAAVGVIVSGYLFAVWVKVTWWGDYFHFALYHRFLG